MTVSKRTRQHREAKRQRTIHKNSHRAKRSPFNTPTALLTSFGLGFLRPAPGTWGSLPPAGLAFIFILAGANQATITAAMLSLAIAATFVCVKFGKYAEQRFHRKDAAEVVADETAGGSLPFLFIPPTALADASLMSPANADRPIQTFLTAATISAIGFLTFRAFDILKPPPARSLEQLHAGWGVAADDLMAGLYALLCTYSIIYLIM